MTTTDQPFYSVTITKRVAKGEPRSDMPDGYAVKGYTDVLPTVGPRWIVLRTERNGLKRVGLFETSEVQGVVHDEVRHTVTIETRNSVYDVTYKVVTEASIDLSDADLDTLPPSPLS